MPPVGLTAGITSPARQVRAKRGSASLVDRRHRHRRYRRRNRRAGHYADRLRSDGRGSTGHDGAMTIEATATVAILVAIANAGCVSAAVRRTEQSQAGQESKQTLHGILTFPEEGGRDSSQPLHAGRSAPGRYPACWQGHAPALREAGPDEARRYRCYFRRGKAGASTEIRARRQAAPGTPTARSVQLMSIVGKRTWMR
jgi:hypothetical protein